MYATKYTLTRRASRHQHGETLVINYLRTQTTQEKKEKQYIVGPTTKKSEEKRIICFQ